MTTRVLILITSMISVLLAGCVTRSEFRNYKEDMEKLHEKVANNDAILFCESQIDAYEDLMNTDEPDPTRRDEPDGTRRDLAVCEAEMMKIQNKTHFDMCRIEMKKCADDGVKHLPTCRACFATCMGTGSWDTGTCPQ